MNTYTWFCRGRRGIIPSMEWLFDRASITRRLMLCTRYTAFTALIAVQIMAGTFRMYVCVHVLDRKVKCMGCLHLVQLSGMIEISLENHLCKLRVIFRFLCASITVPVPGNQACTVFAQTRTYVAYSRERAEHCVFSSDPSSLLLCRRCSFGPSFFPCSHAK